MKRNWSQDIFNDFASFQISQSQEVEQKMSVKCSKSLTPNNSQVSKSSKKIKKKDDISFNDSLLYSTHLWSERFQPYTIDELIINKKKISQFEDMLLGKNKLIILDGPRGCGKHTLLRVLCNKNNIQMVRWSNSYSDIYNNTNDSIREFIRSGCYLNLCDDSFQPDKMLVIDDVPDYRNRNQAYFKQLLYEFHNRLAHKMIFIYTSQDSDCAISTFYSMIFDDKTVKELDALILKLNPLTVTALNKICKKISNELLESSKLKELIKSCNGDGRYLLNTLHFIQSRDIEISDYLKIKIPNITFVQRDILYDLFHTTGRLFYAKYTDNTDQDLLPSHMQSYKRNILSLDINEFIRTMRFSSQQIIYTIHENCIGFLVELENITIFYDNLSQVELFLNTWDDNRKLLDDLHTDCLHIIVRSFAYYNTSSERKQKFQPIYSSKVWSLTPKITKNISSRIEMQKHFLYSRKDYILDIEPYFGDKIHEYLNLSQIDNEEQLHNNSFENSFKKDNEHGHIFNNCVDENQKISDDEILAFDD